MTNRPPEKSSSNYQNYIALQFVCEDKQLAHEAILCADEKGI